MAGLLLRQPARQPVDLLLMTQVTDAGTLPITRKVRNCILAELLSQEGAAS